MRIWTIFVCVGALLLGAHDSQASDLPKLRQGMSLKQAREVLINAGWIVQKNSKCLTHSGIRDETAEEFKTGECTSLYSDTFYLNFTEYEGSSLNSLLIYGLYRDGFGKCISVTFTYRELDTESDDLAKKMSVESWNTEKCPSN
jgi:hypothetical protein